LKLKVVIFFIIIFLIITGIGCSGTYEGTTTGIRYVLAQGNPAELPVEKQVEQVSPSLVSPVHSPSPGEPVQEDKKATDMPSPVKETKEAIDPAIPVSLPSEENTGHKTVYLTFDDGPNDTETPKILDILDSYGVKGTFFVIGTNIEKHPVVFKEALRRGHTVGNHTYDHKYSEVYASHDAFLESIRKNEELIFQIAGIRPKVVRDPGGQVRNDEVVKGLLAQNGYTLVGWNIDSYDSRKPSHDSARIVESVRSQAANARLWSNMIILMHDGTGHMETVRALPAIIELLQSQGFKFSVLK